MKLVTKIAVLVLAAVFCLSARSAPVEAAGATTEVRVIKYADDGITVLSETTVSYQWMEENLPVRGDGTTHYYHQGPVFEGDMWDPSETVNLKDKGAVKGTAIRDLCDLAGGMQPGDEVRLVAVDGWSTAFGYDNIYQPMEQQGTITICWFNGSESQTGEKFGVGYPGVESFHSAMQIVFMAGTTNLEGKFVFGNDDMRITLPQEEYQHYYQGLPSTNGLSGKWIDRLVIYSKEAVPTESDTAGSPFSGGEQPDLPESARTSRSSPVLWLILGLGILGLGMTGLALYRLRRQAHR